ncbi:hypothetical protein FS749_012069 [Ceratobasidium sp. UAMH 11750]|nr:hypothetical protein FS749_012069 [Ceratobasidium sp. UAMH 11750]
MLAHPLVAFLRPSSLTPPAPPTALLALTRTPNPASETRRVNTRSSDRSSVHGQGASTTALDTERLEWMGKRRARARQHERAGANEGEEGGQRRAGLGKYSASGERVGSSLSAPNGE